MTYSNAPTSRIKNILFPTDFSEASRNALKYAVDMAEHVGARVLMLHVYHEIPVAEGVAPAGFLQKLSSQKEERALAHFHQYENEIYSSLSENVELVPMIESGRAFETILSVAEREAVDMIVMGTKGAASMAHKIFGSLTTRVIEASECPVLAVPEGVSFQPIRHILYASNFEEADFVVLDQLLDYADLFGATLSCAHVYAGEEYWNQLDRSFFERLYQLESQNEQLKFYTFNHRDVVHGLHRFICANKVDMLAMLTHRREAIHQVLEESLTREMTLHTDVPLLAFHDAS